MPLPPKNPRGFQRLIVGPLLGLLILSACATPPGAATSTDDAAANLARQMHAKGDDQSAATFYTRALQKDPNDAALHKEFGALLEAHNDFDGAAEHYRDALGIKDLAPEADDITSDDLDLLRAYGRVLVRAGHPDKARPVYVRALEIEPGDIRALNGIGVCLDEMGNHQTAQKFYLEALQNNATDPATLANLGHSYVLSGSYNEAIQLLEPHIAGGDATPALRQNLAEAYAMNGMDSDAERVGRIDLSNDQVKQNMAYYHARRHQMAAGALLYADLGNYPTKEMADANAEAIKTDFPADTENLDVRIIPQIAMRGGTPSFSLRATGFQKVDTLRLFCDYLKSQGRTCSAHSGD